MEAKENVLAALVDESKAGRRLWNPNTWMPNGSPIWWKSNSLGDRSYSLGIDPPDGQASLYERKSEGLILVGQGEEVSELVAVVLGYSG